MAPLDDEARSMLLFPTFPTAQWDVRFKMHAPLNTTVEASCQGALAVAAVSHLELPCLIVALVALCQAASWSI